MRGEVGSPLGPRVVLARGGGLHSSTVEIAASPPPVCLESELALQLHQAPHLGAIGTEVGLDLGGRGSDDGQVDAEQLGGTWGTPGDSRG